MSHIALIKTNISDLDLLEQACEELGLELVRDKSKFWSYRDREGSKHVIRIKEGTSKDEKVAAMEAYCKRTGASRVRTEDHVYNASNRSFEIGVTENQDGTLAFLTDEYMSGGGMLGFAGPQGDRIKQRYAVKLAERELMGMGCFLTTCEEQADGSFALEFDYAG